MAHASMNNLFNNEKFVKMYKTAEQFTGHYAGELIERSHFKDDLSRLDKVVVLDNACGTGIVSVKIMDLVDNNSAEKVDLTCADFSDAMIGMVKPRIESGPIKKIRAVKADAQDTKLPSSHFTHIFFSFGPMLLPNPLSGLNECYRMLAPGGLLGINTWQHLGWYNDFRDGLAKDSEFPSLPSEEKFVQGFSKTKERWDRPNFVREHFEASGFVDIKVESVPAETPMQVDEAVEMLPQVMGIIHANYWSEEQRNDASLKEKAAKAVEKQLREKYSSGTIVWNWVGIVGMGRKPE